MAAQLPPYGQNFEFSSFPLLCEHAYRKLQEVDNRISRRMPFSGFLHHCVTGLNLMLLYAAEKEKKLDGELRVRDYLADMKFPQSILVFFTYVWNTITYGEEQGIKLNIPEAAIPRDVEGQQGTFGTPTLLNHNLYECYASPLVTRRRIEASLARNHDWTPLPEELAPPGLRPTQNLIGFGPIDELNFEGINALTNLRFPGVKSTGKEARVQYSGELTARCNSVLNYLPRGCELEKEPNYNKILRRFEVFLEVAMPMSSTSRLADARALVWHPKDQLGHNYTFSYLHGVRRRRSVESPGCCFVNNDGTNPEGWVETRNYNFEFCEPFASDKLHGKPILRESNLEYRIGPSPTRILIERYTNNLQLWKGLC